MLQQELILAGHADLARRVTQAEAGLVEAGAVIREQRRQLDQFAGTPAVQSDPKQSFVDTRAIGKPPSFTGESLGDGKPDGLVWGQCSFLFRAYVGAYSKQARTMLEEAESQPERPEGVLEGKEAELSAQIFYILALTFRGRSLGVVQRVVEGNGLEAWRLLCVEVGKMIVSYWWDYCDEGRGWKW